MFKTRALRTMAIVSILALSFGSQAIAATKTPTNGSVKLTNAEVTPFTSVQVGGGTWDYGTELIGLNQKRVWSNYLHLDKVHGSSCTIGTASSDSGWVNPGKTSFSSAIGAWTDYGYSYWRVQ